jgi:hypothetical protein
MFGGGDLNFRQLQSRRGRRRQTYLTDKLLLQFFIGSKWEVA